MTERTATDWIVDTPMTTRYPVYTRMNANDVLPEPISPLGASLCWEPQIMPGWWAGYAMTGAFTPEEFESQGPAAVSAFAYGRLYVNQTAVRVLGIRGGIGWQAIDTAFFGGANAGAPPHDEDPSDVSEAATKSMMDTAGWALTTTTYPDLEEDRQIADRMRSLRPDFSAMTPSALVSYARTAMPVVRLMWRGETGAGISAATGPAVANAVLGETGPALVPLLISNAGDVDSAGPSFALWDLGRTVAGNSALNAEFDRGGDDLLDRLNAGFPAFVAEFAAFLRDFGYRGPSEWDIASPAWETHPDLALALVDRLRLLDDDRSPHENFRRIEEASAGAWAQARDQLGADSEAFATLQGAIASAKRFQSWRERGKANAIKALHEGRLPLLELGRRLHKTGDLAHPGQIFMALDDELDVLALAGAAHLLRDRLDEREAEWRALFDLQEPTFIDSRGELPAIADLPRRSAPTAPRAVVGDVLKGEPTSFGSATGIVRIITDMANIGDFEPGEILVAPQTDPSWTPLFMVASAVVVDVGSISSHAVIVSRELGIPCAAGVSNATLRLRTGDTVEVDATAGEVRVLSVVD